jgi:hypothetical protein
MILQLQTDVCGCLDGGDLHDPVAPMPQKNVIYLDSNWAQIREASIFSHLVISDASDSLPGPESRRSCGHTPDSPVHRALPLQW